MKIRNNNYHPSKALNPEVGPVGLASLYSTSPLLAGAEQYILKLQFKRSSKIIL